MDRRAGRLAGSFMVHVHAPWGAGKSSLLNFLAADLRNRDEHRTDGWHSRVRSLFPSPRRTADDQLSQWIVVEFSAWEHQRLTAPWWWLLSAIQRASARELWLINRGRWAWFWIRDIAWRIWNARAAVFSMLVVAGAVLLAHSRNWFGLHIDSLSAVQAAIVTSASAIALATTIFGMTRGAGRWLAIGSAEGAIRFLRRAPDPLSVYRRRFQWLVRSSGRPIAVFIDDLDRCHPAYVVELLEGIQTLFATEPVTYVIAADRSWLCKSFATTYSEFEDSVGEVGRPLGFLFLEKTFQISMEIPPMSDDEQGAYWNLLMRGGDASGDTNGESPRGPGPDAFEGASTQVEIEDRVDKLLRANTDKEEVLAAAVRRLNAPDMQEHLERLLSEFAPLLEKNPRSMKRLINAYGIERDRLLRNGYLLSREERRQLALLTILRLRWPEFADHLRRYPDDVDYCLATDKGVPNGHPFEALYRDSELQRLFDCSHIDIGLNRSLIEHFPRNTRPTGRRQGP